MSSNPDKPSKRILVADDDPIIRHLINTIVTREGYKVVAVNDGSEAYRILQRDADFSAAIFDMMMPGLKGLDLLRYMRTEHRLLRIPVMMITSAKDLKVMTDLFAAGATAILPKPFSSLQIQSMLNMLIAQQHFPSSPVIKKPKPGTHWRIGV